MPAAPLPPDEKIRLQTLRELHILDTSPEDRFDRLTRLVQHIFQVPISTVTLIDDKRQWFKSRIGLDNTETSRDRAFCAYTIQNSKPLVVPDATTDARFSDNPLVTGAPGIRAYAGAPIILPNGTCPGSLCAIDTVPRQFTETQLSALQDVAAIASEELSKVELNFAIKRLRFLASHDDLTGLRNRAGFEELLEQTMARKDGRGAVLYVDMDNFKLVNDSEGHAAGDRLLVQVADLLRAACGETGTGGRMGGDEFAVLLPDHTLDEARKVGEQLRRQLDDFVFPTDTQTFQISASLGLAPLEGTASQVLDRADTACYLAKSRGRNRLEIHQTDPSELKLLRDDIGWQHRIRDAMRNNTLLLWFQPIMEISSGRITHCEALIRLCDRPGEVVSPMAFLPAIERFNMTPEFDRYVLRHAARHLVNEPNLRLAVNLSGKSFLDVDLIAYVQNLFQNADVDPDRVTLEITEREVIGNLPLAKALITSLRKIGFYFALDDFGSGFSSFSYLKMLPVSTLKIDGSFIRDMQENTSNRVFVRAMNDIAQFFGIRSLAEFVEDEATMEILRDIGIDYAQGYYIGKPSPRPTPCR